MSHSAENPKVSPRIAKRFVFSKDQGGFDEDKLEKK